MSIYEHTLRVFAEQFLPDEGKIPLGTEVMTNEYVETWGRLITPGCQYNIGLGDYFCTLIDDTGYLPKHFIMSKEKFESLFTKVSD